MIYLILSLILACLTYVIFKVTAVKKYNTDRVTVYNYTVVMVLAVITAATNGQHRILARLGEGSLSQIMDYVSPGNTALILAVFGVLLGILFAVNFIQTKESIADNGAGITSFFKQTGFIGGLFIAIIFLGERPTAIQWVGIVMILAALAIMISDLKTLRIKTPSVLLLLLLSGALVEADNKFFAKYAVNGYQMLFLAVGFAAAGIYSVIYFAIKWRRNGIGPKFSRWEILWGVLLGTCNLFNNYFKLKSLEVLPASIVIPTISAGTLVLTMLLGIFVYKEKTNKQSVIAMLVAVVSITLLNI